MIAELLAKIGVDVSDLNKAEVALKQFESNVEKAFKRPAPGEMRAESAFTGIIQNLTAGNIPGAIESVTAKLHGMGVIGGAAFATILFGMTKAIQSAKETEAAFEALNKTLLTQSSAAEGIEALGQKAVQSAQVFGKTLEEQLPTTAGEKIWRYITQSFTHIPEALVNQLLHPLSASGRMDEQERRERARQEAITAGGGLKLSDEINKQSEAQKLLAEMTEAQLTGNKFLAAEKKDQADYDLAILRINNELIQVYDSLGDKFQHMSPANQKEVNDAIKHGADQAKESQGRIKELKDEAAQRELDSAKEQITVETQVAAVKSQALSADVEKNALAQVNIAHLERQVALSKGLTDIEKARLAAQLAGAQAELLATQGQRERTLTDRGKFSFEELLARPERGITGYSTYLARQAQHEFALGESARLRGLPEEAAKYISRGEAIKAGIPLLKESEKDQTFALANAINTATVFKDMSNNLATIADAVKNPGNPFLNK
jgi:hypothetical protein